MSTIVSPSSAESVLPAATRGRWPLVGVAAGVLGYVATVITDLHVQVPDNGATTAAVVADISRTKAQLSVVAGYLAVAALLVFAAAWRRHVEPRVTTSTAARVVSSGLVSAAGALAVGYGFKGMFAVYLPGGLNGGDFDQTGLYITYLLNDFGSFLGWLGVAISAGAIAWMALWEGTISRWIGVVSVLGVVAVLGMTVAFGLPGFAGVVMPGWLLVTSLGLTFGRSPINR